VDPAAHTQSLLSVLPSGETEFAGQFVHPIAESAYQPALHTQSVIAVLLAGEIAFAGHNEHAAGPVVFLN